MLFEPKWTKKDQCFLESFVKTMDFMLIKLKYRLANEDFFFESKLSAIFAMEIREKHSSLYNHRN